MFLFQFNRASMLFYVASALLCFGSLISGVLFTESQATLNNWIGSHDLSVDVHRLDLRQPRPLMRLVAASPATLNDESEEKVESDKTSNDEKDAAKADAEAKPAQGKFDDEISFDEFNLDEDASIEPSASDWEKAEIVPTPVAIPEIVAEVVPTPLGMPERALAELRSVRKPPMIPRTRSDVLAVVPPHVGGVLVTPVNNSVKTSTMGIGPKIDAVADNPSDKNASPRIAANPIDVERDASLTDNSEIPKIAGMAKESPEGFGPIDYTSWKTPDVSLFITGQQHGYIEPCGCTGLENQKGGVARRMTFANQLRDKGWELLPVDAGNLIRRFGRQAEIKFHRSLESLREMGYVAVGFGPDDVRISVGDLIQEAAAEKPEDMIYASANVVLVDPSLMPSYQIVQRGGMKVAITSILDPDSLEAVIDPSIMLGDPVASAKDVIEKINAEEPDYTVLTYYGKDAAAEKLVQQVNGFDLVVVAGGYGEPTYQPEAIKGSSTKMILTGNKGMYVGLVALYRDESKKSDHSMKYARVPLTHEFEDAPEMRKLMKEYQFQLRDLGLEMLEVRPIPHPSGREFIGSETCGECHTNAFDIWQGSAHFEATEHLVNPGERGDVSRHFDPECISCHVTGWNPQNYYPYQTGYLDLEADSHLHGNGCENCHGPGAAHAAAESGDESVSDEVRDLLRKSMQLPLDQAREKCMECHDLDNSPDFHADGAFDDYWAEVEHYGMD